MELIYLKDTGKYGRGVFARYDIKIGQVIEVSPVILLPREECSFIKDTTISDYWFSWQVGNFDSAIVLGYGSLFNHSYTPNAVFYNMKDHLSVIFYAISNIKADEEITVNYNGDPEDKSPLWFNVIE